MADPVLSKWLGGPLWYKNKKYANGAQHSGPAGRRKSNPRNIMARALAGTVKVSVIYCNDQHGSMGTGVRRGM